MEIIPSIFLLAAIAGLTWWVGKALNRLYFHPLSRFPGPRLAAVTTLYQGYIDVVAQSSFVHTLEALHAQYGPIVRVQPNVLHFSSPEVYHEIYTASNRWDKEETLYHSFGEDRSSFGFLAYAEAKPRKDILSRALSKGAVRNTEKLIEEKVLELCQAFNRASNKPVDLFFAYRCFSIDIITYLCFGESVDALQAEDFQAPIVLALSASIPAFSVFKYSSLVKNMIIKCPPGLSRVISPATAGLVNLQESIRNQVRKLTTDPDHLKTLPHTGTIWNELLRPEVHADGKIPDQETLFEESQALMFGGADTTGTTLMHGTFEILHEPEALHKLKAELKEAWPDINQSLALSELEALPYLTAVIKESLRMSPGVASPLPRVVPDSGATLDGVSIPGGSIVEMSNHFVHRNKDIFPEPNKFVPERWLGPSGRDLDKWQTAFSRGPRMCIGLNLAWAELYLAFGHVFRKFDLELDPSSPNELKWRDVFLAEYLGPHLKVKMRPAKD